MVKNAFLSIKKNIGKTILLFVIMFVIANLVIAGFAIKSASSKSVDAIKNTLGNEVTLSVDFRNMMKNRDQEDIEGTTASLTTAIADQLKDLQYVENYNYSVSAFVDSNLTAVETDQQQPYQGDQGRMEMENSGDFSLQANTTMAYLTDFTDENYSLIKGRLLSEEDSGTYNCVIETNLADENSLDIGDTLTITSGNDSAVSAELTIVRIYEIENSTTDMKMMNGNPVNTIYTDLSVGMMMNNDDDTITSAVYYLDDPENVEAFEKLVEEETDVDLETFSLKSNDQLFQNNSSSIDNISSFATLFLIVVVVAGCAILCLILALTIRNRYYEIGVFLSLGQSKIKIIGQQLIEIGLIAAVAFTLSLATGKMTANVISGMLTSNDQEMVMEIDEAQNNDIVAPQQKGRGRFDLQNAFQEPESKELDVSLTGETIIKLLGTTALICVVATIIPTIYILRLSPREILTRKEG